ncbi:MAG: hypothetical protein RSD01_04360 [Ruthenibacterium sp.]
MKTPKLLIRKILLGMVLIAIAAGITVFIKESLDTQDPESALPIIRVEYNGIEMPPAVIYRAGYEWSFFTTMERQAPTLAQEDLPITPYDMQPDAAIKISFSKTPSTLRVWRANGRYSTDFTELASEDKSTFTTPHDAGVYLYKVKAEWGRRGFIQYYFAVDVKKQ